MTCGEFECLLPGLVRQRPLAAAVLKDAEEHARGCLRCEARLSGERELTAALRLWASSEPAGPRPELEAKLLSQFRAERRRRPAARRWMWASAAAACALAAASLGVMRSLRPNPATPARQAEGPVAQVAPAPVAPPAKLDPVPAQASKAKPRRRVSVAARRPAPPARVTPREAAAVSDEVATGFMPVSWGAASTGYASLVRLKVSRSALLSYGLPVNPEGATGWIQADVLVGEDGVARAIRFIQ